MSEAKRAAFDVFDLRTLETTRRFMPQVPALAFLLVVVFSLGSYYAVTDTVDLIRVRAGSLADPIDAARFASAARVWAATNYAGWMTIVVVLAISVATIVQLGRAPHRGGRERAFVFRWLLGIGVVFAAGLFVEFGLNDTPALLDLRTPDGRSLLPVRLHWFISGNNAMMMTAIAALFGASSAIIRRAQHVEPTSGVEREGIFDGLRRRLTSLLGIGAVATVVGVLNRASLLRLPGAALDSEPKDGQAAIRAALDGLAGGDASYWGIVFTVALALLYLPAAWTIRTEELAAPRLLGEGASASPTDSDAVLRPLLKILTAMAPLLVGVLSQLLSTATSVVG